MTAEELIQQWKEIAKRHGYVLNDRKAGFIEKTAKICIAVVHGACVCKPRERPQCPCDEMHKDIRVMGSCYCKLFLDPNWQGEYGVVRKENFSEA